MRYKWPLYIGLLTIPATVLAGVYLLEDRRYMVISLLVLFQVFIPFVLRFERRKPPARALVMLAVLCAIAVAGRGIFFMLPHVKPTLAIIIIGGVALGAHTGFLLGAMTALVSNMFFGQGPWTPWQMLAMGLVGLLAGLFFRKRTCSRVLLALYGALATIVIFGGIMNPASVLLFQPEPTPGMFAAAFIYGLPFDLIHAGATAVFILLLSRSFMNKIDRIKIKFGEFS